MPVPPFPASFPGGGFIGPTQMPDHPSLVRKSASTGVIGAVPMWRKAWEIGGPATECSLTIGVCKTGWKPHGIPWVPWFIIVWNGHNLGSTPFLDQPHLTRPRDTALLPLLGTLQQRSPAGFVLGEEVAVHRLRWEVPGWKCKDFLDFPPRIAQTMEMLVGSKNIGRRKAISTPQRSTSPSWFQVHFFRWSPLWRTPRDPATSHGIVLVDVEQRNLLKALPVLRVHTPWKFDGWWLNKHQNWFIFFVDSQKLNDWSIAKEC